MAEGLDSIPPSHADWRPDRTVSANVCLHTAPCALLDLVALDSCVGRVGQPIFVGLGSEFIARLRLRAHDLQQSQTRYQCRPSISLSFDFRVTAAWNPHRVFSTCTTLFDMDNLEQIGFRFHLPRTEPLVPLGVKLTNQIESVRVRCRLVGAIKNNATVRSIVAVDNLSPPSDLVTVDAAEASVVKCTVEQVYFFLVLVPDSSFHQYVFRWL